jgi:hypothetical protein
MLQYIKLRHGHSKKFNMMNKIKLVLTCFSSIIEVVPLCVRVEQAFCNKVFSQFLLNKDIGLNFIGNCKSKFLQYF